MSVAFLFAQEVRVQAPNVISVAVIVGAIALCQGLADTLPVLGQPWVPFAIVALGALVKGLQVYLQQQGGGPEQMTAGSSTSPLRRWLVG